MRLKIFLADLTYTTLSLATEAFPLNIGFVGSYCKMKYGSEVEIRLFKYLEELDNAIREDPPHLLGMSNYPWNQNAGIQIFELTNSISPSTIRVMGGPSIPQIKNDRDQFVRRFPVVDFFTYLEGEEPFSNIVGKMLSGNSSRRSIKSGKIPGVIYLENGNQIVNGEFVKRRKILDEIPSPYLNGALDQFFDGLLSPMIETNRGCPFTCTFCHEGSSIMTKVNYFSLERVLAELDYIAEHTAEGVGNLMFTDPNFGMFERDLEICEHIARIQAKKGWPKSIFASTGKNKKERISKAVSVLNGTMKMWLSVQSMDEQVLKSIKRQNINVDTMMQLSENSKKMGIPTYSELIVGLPGESYDSHLNSIKKLVNSNIDFISTYNLMLLDGSELMTRSSREQYGLNTHFRVIPRDFAMLSNGKLALEIEEIVTSTNNMTFAEYLNLRKFHLIINIIYNSGLFQPLLKFLRSVGYSIFELLIEVSNNIDNAPIEVKQMVQKFEYDTQRELWNSESDCRDFMNQPSSYNQLITGELGANLLQTYTAKFTINVLGWFEFIKCLAVYRKDSRSALAKQTYEHMLRDVVNFSKNRSLRIWDFKQHETLPPVKFDYDIAKWLSCRDDKPLSHFRLHNRLNMEFVLDMEQKEIIRQQLDRFGNSPTGIGRIMTKTSILGLLRKPSRVPPEVVSTLSSET